MQYRFTQTILHSPVVVPLVTAIAGKIVEKVEELEEEKNNK